jgi:hypothetical protein
LLSAVQLIPFDEPETDRLEDLAGRLVNSASSPVGAATAMAGIINAAVAISPINFFIIW